MITASIIVGIIASAYGVAGAIYGSVQANRLNSLATKIANALNTNSELKSKVLQAYQDKDYKLANALISNSPVGSAYRNLKNEIDKNKREKDAKIQEIEDSDKELKEAQAGLKTPTNDLIGGVVNSIGDNTAKVDAALKTSSNLIEGGMKNET